MVEIFKWLKEYKEFATAFAVLMAVGDEVIGWNQIPYNLKSWEESHSSYSSFDGLKMKVLMTRQGRNLQSLKISAD